MKKVMLDSSCLYLLSAGKSDKEVFEKQAIYTVFSLVSKEQIELYGSMVLERELKRSNIEKEPFKEVYLLRKMDIPVSETIVDRALEIKQQSGEEIKIVDCLQIACCETKGISLLTVDARLRDNSRGIAKIPVMHPVMLLMDVLQGNSEYIEHKYSARERIDFTRMDLLRMFNV